MKKMILKSLSKVEVKDMSSLLQISGTLKLVTEGTQDMSAETQVSLTNGYDFSLLQIEQPYLLFFLQEHGVSLCNSTVNSLTNISKEQVGFESIQSAVGNLAGSVGQLITAATKDTTTENTTNNELVSLDVYK